MQRDSDRILEQVQIEAATWMTKYGYETWNHYVMTYRYTSGNAGNNIVVYVNGEDVGGQKTPSTYNLDDDASGCGELELGRYSHDMYVFPGNMVIDELIIWEDQISLEHVQNLYYAYEPPAG